MTDKILEVRGLTKTYGGEKKPGAKQPTPTLDVLKGIDIDIYRGDVVCLIGPSGCGKSTFLKTLNRMNDLVPGIRIEGEVENSIIFRGCKIAKGAVVKDSIIMQGGTICEGVELSYVVTDKGVTVREDRKMMGHATYPVAIAKNTIV